jgi:hypothetical protein
MGFLKKITRPISKVLDKIVPNEIKPALPFLAAATPFLLPAGFGIGSLSPMVSRALAAGAANLGSQLAQEGSEGDFSGASLALATGIGALSAPGAGDTLRGGNVLDEFGTAGDVYGGTAIKTPTGFIGKGKEFLATGADKLQGIMAAGKAEPFSMAGLKAASIPITQGTMDLGIAETRRLNKQQIVDDALSGLGEGFSNADASSAIRLAMLQYGFGDDEITETIAAAGYKAGGRVGLMMGGDPDFAGIKGAVEGVDKNMRADRAGDFFRLRDEAIQKGDDDKIKEIESDFFKEFGMVMPKTAKDGGLMNLGGKEMDLRKGGFVPIGKKEKADDVPARLSKNEFVMTADAVRAAGGGSVNKGAKRMYDLMNKLEARV